MSLPYILDDYDLEGFLKLAAGFGTDRFGYVVTPNVDHLIRFHDEPVFRALYADAAYILMDSRFLSIIFRVLKATRVRVCTGSDLTAQLFARVIGRDDRVVLIGGDDFQARLLENRYGLQQLRHFNPPMGFIRDPREVEKCITFIEDCSPFRFCFLAVGAPQQEVIAQKLKSRGVARGMALCIGAAINFFDGSGTTRARLDAECGIGMALSSRAESGPTREALSGQGSASFSITSGHRRFGQAKRDHSSFHDDRRGRNSDLRIALRPAAGQFVSKLQKKLLNGKKNESQFTRKEYWKKNKVIL